MYSCVNPICCYFLMDVVKYLCQKMICNVLILPTKLGSMFVQLERLLNIELWAVIQRSATRLQIRQKSSQTSMVYFQHGPDQQWAGMLTDIQMQCLDQTAMSPCGLSVGKPNCWLPTDMVPKKPAWVSPFRPYLTWACVGFLWANPQKSCKM